MRMISRSTAFFQIAILAAALVLGGCGLQPDRKPAAAEDLTVREVWPVPGLTKDQLFDAANKWVANSFSNDVDIIQYANRRQGIVVGKTYIPYQRPNSVGLNEKYDLRFTLVVEVKDGKVRTTFTDLHLFSLNEIGTIYDTDTKIIRNRLNQQARDWISSLTAEKKDDSW
jgi:hypothetical protein